MTQTILLKTTISPGGDDWCINRFGLLPSLLEGITDTAGLPRFRVVAKDRVADPDGNDPDLVRLADSDVSQVWLFAVDVVNALTDADIAGIEAFRRRGGGLLTTRDHQDMGACLTRLGPAGAAHHFHSVNREPDPMRHTRDDPYTTILDFPNYHSGANGDCQEITVHASQHPLVQRRNGSGETIRYLPAHPHEGTVSVPPGAEGFASLLVSGRSKITGNEFGILVAVDGETGGDGAPLGRAIAESTFHHFCDYNFDPAMGCPSFVGEPHGIGIFSVPRALEDARDYLCNMAEWLSP